MKYRLMREDENSNIFKVDPICVSYEEAKRLQDEYEARGHKQFYWIVSIEEKSDTSKDITP
ncbi:MAG: hypothetical protein Q8R30_02990 [bacterium]|nr:hypothetical protein [bacterium]